MASIAEFVPIDIQDAFTALQAKNTNPVDERRAYMPIAAAYLEHAEPTHPDHHPQTDIEVGLAKLGLLSLTGFELETIGGFKSRRQEVIAYTANILTYGDRLHNRIRMLSDPDTRGIESFIDAYGNLSDAQAEAYVQRLGELKRVLVRSRLWEVVQDVEITYPDEVYAMGQGQGRKEVMVLSNGIRHKIVDKRAWRPSSKAA